MCGHLSNVGLLSQRGEAACDLVSPVLYNRPERRSFLLARGDNMARGREKDRKTRKKHRKNQERLKRVARARRAAAKRGKRG
jgi:hypothetical protein